MPKIQSPHIIQLPGNELGKDFITTDPHGDFEVLKKVIENYLDGDRNKDNRLFICGDLVDRGPDGLKIIRYVQDYNKDQQRIYAIRGNHEDMALNILNFVELLDAVENKSMDEFDWEKFIIPGDYKWMSESQDWYLQAFSEKGERFLELAKHFLYGKDDDAKYFKSFREMIANNFSARGGENSIAIRNLFSNAISAIGNGGGWVLKLSQKERDEVRSFIDALPYMIRVTEVQLNGSVIAAFDVVHAAPLSEGEIQAALNTKPSIFSKKQIAYVTWARPPETYREGEDRWKIKHQGRTSESTVTYVGHNVLSSYCT